MYQLLCLYSTAPGYYCGSIVLCEGSTEHRQYCVKFILNQGSLDSQEPDSSVTVLQ